MNSLAAIACTEAIGLPFDTIRKGLLSFGGTHRRFEYKGSLGDVTVIDDYAHHPTEIRATLSAAKDYPHDELWVIFQPHTYTRTKAFLPEFAKALEQADHIVLADIYAAREVDTGEVSSKDVMKLLQEDGQDVHYFPSFEEIKDFVKAHVKGHDLLITMGAGNVVEIGEELLAEKYVLGCHRQKMPSLNKRNCSQIFSMIKPSKKQRIIFLIDFFILSSL